MKSFFFLAVVVESKAKDWQFLWEDWNSCVADGCGEVERHCPVVKQPYFFTVFSSILMMAFLIFPLLHS